MTSINIQTANSRIIDVIRAIILKLLCPRQQPSLSEADQKGSSKSSLPMIVGNKIHTFRAIE